MTAAEVWVRWAKSDPAAVENDDPAFLAELAAAVEEDGPLDSDAAARYVKALEIRKHLGPGPHPSGSEQTAHNGGSRLAPNRGDVTRGGAKEPAFLTHEGGVAVGGDNLKAGEIPLAEFDSATAPPVGTHSLPEKTTRSLLVNKVALYDTTPQELYDNIVGLADEAADLYEEIDAGGGGSLSELPKWVTHSDYADIKDQLVEIDGDSWEWKKGAGDVLRHRDRFYQRWNADLSRVSKQSKIDMLKVVGLSATISPNLNANINLAYAEEISRLVAANPKMRPDQIETVNALLERQGFDFRYGEGARLLDAPDGQVMARAGGIIRSSDEQWRVYNPSSEKSFAVGRTWDNFSKGFNVASGRVSVDDALNGIKIRSFTNNIMDPTNLSGMDDVTIDYQTVDLAFNLTGSGGITDITSSGAYQGIDLGVRPVVADLIRRSVFNPDGSITRVAKRSGTTSSLEMQEVLWAQFKRREDAGQRVGTFWRDENPLFTAETAPKPSQIGKPRSIPDWVKANKATHAARPKGKQREIEDQVWDQFLNIIES